MESLFSRCHALRSEVFSRAIVPSVLLDEVSVRGEGAKDFGW